MNDRRFLFSLMRQLWQHISRRQKTQLAALAGLMIFATIAEIFSLGMVLPFLGALTSPRRIFEHPVAQPIVSAFGLDDPKQILWPLTLLFGFAALVSGATRLALLWGQTRLGNAIGAELGAEAYRRTLYQPYAVHAMRNSSEVVAVLMTKINTIIYFIIIPLLTLLASVVIVLAVVGFLILVDPALTLATILGFGFFYGLIAFATNRKLARDGKRVAEGQSHIAQVVQEGLGGIRDVLIDGLQETYSRIFRQADSQLRRALANIAIIGGAPRPLMEACGVVLIGLIAYSMSIRAEGMAAAIPMLGALALAAQRLLPLVQQGYSSWTAMSGGRDSLRDVLNLLAQPLPRFSALPPPKPLPFKNHIELVDLDFRYVADGEWILKGINLRIPRGSRIGFIGSTGGGKSTLLDVIMGLLTPTSGTLRIDECVVDENNHRSWQAHIAHVPQSIYLADTAIAENIAFGIPSVQINHGSVRQAAERARIADTIESWPDGYETLVGERGVRLSGGQRQRVGIARALYKKADVLVLDEATSALDADTEQEVMDAIESSGTDLTILIVAHRLSTLRNCTQVVELAQGRIVQSGPYEEMVGAADAQSRRI